MRVLFVVSPGLGHNFPLVPLAWAVRAAGHDVLWSTSTDTAANAGLPSEDPAPGVDWHGVFGGFFRRHPELAGMGGDDTGRLDFVGRLFAEVSEPAVDGTVRLAQRFRPDVVVYSPLQGAGPLTAAALGVPAVLHGISPGTATPELGDGVAAWLGDAYQRHHAAPTRPAAVVSVTPPSMAGPAEQGWPVRYLPYNGGAQLPAWLSEAQRPRVAVTLGSVVPGISGAGVLQDFLAAAGDLDAEFVLALGGTDVGPLPPNMRPVDWLPLSALLPTCAAVIHHGGSGTTMTALDAGIPQLVLPHGADQFLNAHLVTAAGLGATVTAEELTVDRVAALLKDTSVRAAAQRLAAEMRAMPAPAELVPRLAGLV